MFVSRTVLPRLTTGAALAATLAIGLAAVPARAADQVVLLDYWFINRQTHISAVGFKPSAETPKNFTSPIDYTKGRVYSRVEMVKKPSNLVMNWIYFFICKAGTGGKHPSSSRSAYFTKPGVYDWSTAIKDFWYHTDKNGVPVESCDWSQGITSINLSEDTPTQTHDEQTNMVLYAPDFPQTLRVTLTLVPPGGTYVPPPRMAPPSQSGYVPPMPMAPPSDGGVDGGPAADAGSGDVVVARDANRDTAAGLDVGAPDEQPPPSPGGSMPLPPSQDASGAAKPPTSMPPSQVMPDDEPPAQPGSPTRMGGCSFARAAAGPPGAVCLSLLVVALGLAGRHTRHLSRCGGRPSARPPRASSGPRAP